MKYSIFFKFILNIILYSAFLFVLFFSLILNSCTSTYKNKDLAKVIKYYSKPKDSLKYKAAIYLINNMRGLSSLDSISIAENEQYFTCLDTAYKRLKAKPSYDFVFKTLDEFLINERTTPLQPQAKYFYDLDVITADFLIENIDYAFESWQKNPWSKQIPFDVFCEYILPYRATNTYMQGFRQYFINKYDWITDSSKGNMDCFKIEQMVVNEINSWYVENTGIISKYPFLLPMKFSNIIKGRIGTCEEANAIKAAALMSLGVPVGMDFLPQWGNHDASHFLYKVLDSKHDTVKCLLSNLNTTMNFTHLMSGVNTTDYTNIQGIPSHIVPKHIRTVPKVFRKCYTRQLSSLAVLDSLNKDIPKLFLDDHLLDVTDQYLNTADVVVDIDLDISNPYVYLCIFKRNELNPINWAKVQNGKAIFKNMGKDILYIPSIFKNGEIIPIGYPFILEQNGSIKKIIKDIEIQTLNVWRKYPYSMHCAMWASYMINGKFQGANNSEMFNSTTFYTLTTLPFGMNEIKINDNNKYRYLGYRFDDFKMTFPAEIEFYGIENNKEIKLTGKEIGNNGLHGYESKNIWDGDRGTFFQNDTFQNATFVGIDLGEHNERKITKIRYCPRNDTNDILPGEIYELYYWDDKWVFIGDEIGDDMKPLVFNNVPKNALFWLHTEKGKEERIFTYENGKQYFW